MNETFLHLTATGWTAVGSIVGALSVIALSFFNAFALRAANRSARETANQAAIAKQTLDALQTQIREQGVTQRETAIQALENIARDCQSWKGQLSSRNPGTVNLFPREWASMMTFVATRLPSILGNMRELERRVTAVQLQLNNYVRRDWTSRLQITAESEELSNTLDKTSALANGVAQNLMGLEPK